MLELPKHGICLALALAQSPGIVDTSKYMSFSTQVLLSLLISLRLLPHVKR